MKRLDEKTRLVRIREGWGAFCLLGIVMLNYPFIHIFNKPDDTLLGFPLMVLYLFIGWPISIFVIYLFSHYLIPADTANHPDAKSDEEQQ